MNVKINFFLKWLEISNLIWNYNLKDIPKKRLKYAPQ